MVPATAAYAVDLQPSTEGEIDMTKYIPMRGDLAEYTFDGICGSEAEDVVLGDVVKVGKTYADVAWRGGRVERIRFRKPNGVTFRPAA